MTQAEGPNTTNLPGGTVVAGLSSRRRFIGGSDARVIMGQDEKALIWLWQEKRGEVGPEDLSGNLVVQLGLAAEDLNRTWYERNTGRAITAVQSRVKHPVIAFMGGHLVAGTGAVYEAGWCHRPTGLGQSSDARIIMGQDEQTLIRLWQEKRGEVGLAMRRDAGARKKL
jgi:predicted phage-related endonuclease